jgi:HAD superfamily hydrolase (TIGR01509 family)
VDTEWPIYTAAVGAFAELGHELPLETWATIVGLAEGEGGWYDTLTARLGVELARSDFDRAYQVQDRTDRDSLPALPGVVGLLDALDEAGVPAGIASSSEVRWLDRHLRRLGLLDRFAVLAGVDAVGGVGKPAPDSYLFACRALGALPERSVALEDSAHGVAAATAAGMAVVAVPSRITQHTSLVAADLVVPSLTDLSVDMLDRLVARGT